MYSARTFVFFVQNLHFNTKIDCFHSYVKKPYPEIMVWWPSTVHSGHCWEVPIAAYQLCWRFMPCGSSCWTFAHRLCPLSSVSHSWWRPGLIFVCSFVKMALLAEGANVMFVFEAEFESKVIYSLIMRTSRPPTFFSLWWFHHFCLLRSLETDVWEILSAFLF